MLSLFNRLMSKIDGATEIVVRRSAQLHGRRSALAHIGKVIVGGAVLKGPTADFLAHTGHAANAAGVTAIYGDILDGVVADEDGPDDVPTLKCDTMLDTPEARRSVADSTLGFAESLR